MQLKTLLPYTYDWIIKNSLDKKAKTILDVGCGRGELMSFLNTEKKYDITGVDLYKDSLDEARLTGAYKTLKKMDVRKLRFREQSFDIVICSMTLEHLTRKEGNILMQYIERIAKKQVIITTTVGFFPFDPLEGEDENPYQVHKSGWFVEEFRKRGYNVYGQGADFVYGKRRPLVLLNSPMRYVLFGLSYILSPVWYRFATLASYMICVKNK